MNKFEISSEDRVKIEHLSTIVKNSIWTSGGGILAQFITPIISVISTRILGVELYGVFNLLAYWGNLLADFARIGTGDSLLRFIPKYKSRNKDTLIAEVISFTFTVPLIISCLVMVLVIVFSYDLSNILFKNYQYSNYIVLYSPTIVFTTIYLTFISILHSFKNQKRVVFARDIIANLSKLFTLILFAFLGYKLAAALLSNLMRDLTIVGITLFFLVKYFKKHLAFFKLNYSEKKDFSKYSLTLFGQSLFNKYTFRLDVIFLGFLRNTFEVGLYSVALKIQPFIYMVSSSMSLIFSPIVVELFEKKDFGNLSFIYKKVTKWTFMISFPLVCIIVIFSQKILSIFGSSFILASNSLIILCLGSLMADILGLSGQIINMIGKPMINLINSIFLTVIMVILFIILIPKYGIWGAAISYSVGLLIINVARVIEVYKFIGIHPFQLDFLKVIPCGLISSLIVYWGNIFLGNIQANLYLWIVEIVVFFLIYTGFILLFRLDEYDIMVYRILKKSVIGKFKTSK